MNKNVMTIVCAIGITGLLVGAAATSGSAPQEPVRWEYKVLSTAELAGMEHKTTVKDMYDKEAAERRSRAALLNLNQLGEDGWELIQTHNDYCYFKRPVTIATTSD